MRKCPFCGATNFDVAQNCEKCNLPLPENPHLVTNPALRVEKVGDLVFVAKDGNAGLQVAAKVFMVISLVLHVINFFALFIMGIVGWYFEPSFAVIALPFMMVLPFVPMVVSLFMTIAYFKNSRVGIGFKICTLLFVDLIAGILMLCDNNS